MKRVLLKDLASELGLSISQISRALNQKAYVTPEIRAKVLELAQKKNYRNLSGKHTKTIAVIVRKFADFNNSLLNELVRQTEKAGYQLVVVPHKNTDILKTKMFDGAIIISGEYVARKWHNLYNIPLVVINNFGFAMDNISAVLPDADSEIQAAMLHLCSLGHTKIARVRGSSPHSTEQELQRGLGTFYEIAEKFGIQDKVCNCCGETLEDKLEHVKTLIAQGYTAFIVVISDEAPMLLDTIQKCGKRVPEDVSVITYESKTVSAYQQPSLTTLEYNYSKLVSAAIQQLIVEIKNESDVAQILVPCRINIRNSTAQAPK